MSFFFFSTGRDGAVFFFFFEGRDGTVVFGGGNCFGGTGQNRYTVPPAVHVKPWLFQGCTGLWTAGCWLARQLHHLKASTTMDLGISYFIFPYFCTMCGLEKLGILLSKLVGTYWSDLLLRTLVVGRRQ